MSLYSAFYSGLSGLSTNSNALNVIGNNLSNINTVGFKGSDMTFRDIFSTAGASSTQGNGNPIQFGMGVQMNSVNQNFAQSSFQATGNALDMAIQGNGFFTLQTAGGTQVFSRAGNFTRNSDGYLVASDGANVMGWNRSGVNGSGSVVTTGAAVPIQISAATAGAQATANVGVNVNLNASAAVGSTYSSQVQVYDSLGQVQNMVINYTKQRDGQAATSSITAAGTNLTSASPVTTWTPTSVITPNGVVLDTASAQGATQTANVSVRSSDGALHNLTITYTKTTEAANDVWSVAITDATAGATAGAGVIDFGTPANTQMSTQLAIANGSGGTDTITFPLGGITAGTGAAGSYGQTGGTSSTSGTGVAIGGTVVQPMNSSTQKIYDSIGVEHLLSVTYTRNSATKWDYVVTDATTGATNPVGTGSVDFASGLPVQTGTPLTIETSTKVANSIAFSLAGMTNSAAASSGNYTEVGGVVAGNLTWDYNIGDASLNTDGTSRTPVLFGSMQFNSNGNLTALGTTTGGTVLSPTAANNPTFDISWTNGCTNTITFNAIGSNRIANFTGLSSANATVSSTQDGYPAGTLQSMTVDQDGMISGTFTNGQILNLAQLALSSFTNTNGLQQSGNNHWSQTLASGAPTIGVANAAGRGGILGSNLELSNVDVASEFTKLIVSQRGYQANAKIVTTTDELLQVTLNLKQ